MTDASQTRYLVLRRVQVSGERPKWAELRLPPPRSRAATYGAEADTLVIDECAGLPLKRPCARARQPTELAGLRTFAVCAAHTRSPFASGAKETAEQGEPAAEHGAACASGSAKGANPSRRLAVNGAIEFNLR